jgi:hypothetical protein
MDRRRFLGSAVGVSLVIGNLLRISSASAAPAFQNTESIQALAFTDGDIAINNHLSSLARLHRIYEEQPKNLIISSSIINGELINSQFLGDYLALDRLSNLSKTLLVNNAKSAEAYIQIAQISATMHQFEIANDYLQKAKKLNGNKQDIEHVELSILQATAKDQGRVLEARKKITLTSGSPEDFVPYAALLADTCQYESANLAYLKALEYKYKNPSPLIPAWICFQLGMLWGELADPKNISRASAWYERALSYLPQYTKARIHLAEILMIDGKNELALKMLQPALISTDPEVSWKIAEVYAKMNQTKVSAQYLLLANTMFTRLLDKYPLAFADHAAEFYMGLGKNPHKAYELALLNFQNRPTVRAAKLLQNANNSL